MKRNSLFLMMQAVVVLCSSFVMSSCDEIFATEDNPVTSYLQIYEKAVTLKVGDTYTRTAFAAHDAIIEYSSSDVAVATVDQSGLVTAVGAGTALITVRATGYATDGRKIYIEDSKSYEVTVTGGGSSGGTLSYLAWNGTALAETSINAADYTVMTTATTNLAAGFYVVKEDVTITGNLTMTGNAKIILCDGATLTVNGCVYGGADYGTAGTFDLNIYGQSGGTGELKVVNNSINIVVKDINIHSGKIDVTTGGVDQGIEPNGTFNMYGGEVNVAGNYNGIMLFGDINVLGGKLTATSTGGDAIAGGGNATFSNCEITASNTSGGAGNIAIANAITINIAAGITFYEDESANPSANVAGTAGPNAAINCSKHYVEIK